MKKTNLHAVPWEDWSSPTGKFHGMGRQLSAALGATRDAPAGAGSHPFDLEYGKLPPGKAGCPFHSHSSQWELFVVTKGRGTVRFGWESREVTEGDAVMHPPWEAHQLTNTGADDLEYFLVADNPAVDICHYPDSNKWGFGPNGGIFLRTDVDYHRGEDDGSSDKYETPPPRPAAPGGKALARFVRIESIPETESRSPKGRYASFTRDISLAVGGIKDTGSWNGGHPFDLQERRVPPGASVCPFHAHGTQWELFVILAGQATVRSGDETHKVGPDDIFVQPPGTPHQITNSGAGDLRFHVIADNVPAESIFYPDSDKWFIKPQRKLFRMTETDYFDGEE